MIEHKRYRALAFIGCGAVVILLVVFGFTGCGKSGKNLPVTEGTAILAADQVQEITVETASFYFKPSRVTVKVNVPVRMTLVSHTFIIGHNFSLNAPEAGMDIDKNIGHGGKVVIEFTPTKTGEYPFYCARDGHMNKGMTGALVVIP